MFGVPLMGEANVFCNKEVIYTNAAFAESTLKKKHNFICYNRFRECVAADILTVLQVDSGLNLNNTLTKLLPGPQRKYLCLLIMFTDT